MEKMAEALLTIQNVSVDFSGVRAINQLSFDVKWGEINGLIGPNGAGKTTLFNVISRFRQPSEGRVFYEGRDLLAATPHEIVGWGITRTFQGILIFPRLTVLENMMVGLHAKIHSNVLLSGLGFERDGEKEARKRCRDILDFLGIDKFTDQYPQHLSLGQQKLVEIGRAIVSEPRLLLLDEPAGGMNNMEIEKMMSILHDIRSKMGITIFLIEHVMKLVMSVCDRLTVIHHGVKIADGSPETISRDPDVLRVYLGEKLDDSKPPRY